MLEVKCPNCGTSFKIGDGNGSAITADEAKKMNGTSYLVPETIRNENKCECTKGETDMKASELSTEELVAALKAKGLDVFNVLNDNGEQVGNYVAGKVEQKMSEVGYIDFEHEHGRFLTPQTLELLGWSDKVEVKNRYWSKEEYTVDHWTENFRKNPKYDWMYQWKCIERELHRLATIQYKDPKEFAIEVQFYNKEFVYDFCKKYTKTLAEYILRHYTVKRGRHGAYQGYKTCKGVAYVHYNGDDIFNTDIQKKVVDPLDRILEHMKHQDDYKEVERLYRKFVHNKFFCWKTKYRYIDEEFIDVFKGVGAYFTMFDLVKHNGLKLYDYEHDELLNREDSLAYLRQRLYETKGERFKLMAILKNSLYKCNFHFNKEIQNTKSKKNK